MNSPPRNLSPAASAREAPVYVLGLQGASVVIVDDLDSARLLLDEMIRGVDPGISTFLFAGGAEALAWLGSYEPDLVITDHRMPGMTGVQLISEIRRSKRLRHVPVMMITAAEDRALRYEALDAGAVDFLTKPIDPLEVRTRCRNLLLLTRQYRSIRNYSTLQQQQLEQLQALLHSLTGERTDDVARRIEEGELVTVAYDKLFAITSCVAGVRELVVATQRHLADLEAQLTGSAGKAPD
jgi:two-component system response regulator RpfG